MRFRRKEFINHVFFFGSDADNAFTAAALFAVRVRRQPFYITGFGHHNDHIFVGNQILDLKLADWGLHQLGAAFIAELGLEIKDFFFDHAVDFFRGFEKIFELGNQFYLFFEFVFDLFSLKAGKGRQAHLQNRGGLFVGQLEFFHELPVRFFLGF